MLVSEETDILAGLFRNRFGEDPSSVILLPGAGSSRRYYRMEAAGFSVIGAGCDNGREAEAFVKLAGCFRKNGFNVPEIYGTSSDYLHCIQEDLGDTSLFSLLESECAREYIIMTLKALAELQCVNESEWIGLVFNGDFGSRQVMRDLMYFKYSYLNVTGISYDEDLLDAEFERFAGIFDSLAELKKGFMYRDCQSRNVMIHEGKPWWIDFQGGRKGPALYDAVSFLWQAKAGFSHEFRKEMIGIYAREYCRSRGLSEEDFLSDLQTIVIVRTLQVLGAYGFRGLVQHKAHFIESIPGALGNVRELLAENAFDEYPELKRIMTLLVNDNRFRHTESSTLNLRVTSFSFKKGYPKDYSGNGGGFVFDCRGMHNPGRYEEYRNKTGLDREVIDFLEERGECRLFVERAFDLVRPTIERYQQRGFTELQINFGCTGGRHRSVYCAERMGDILSKAFPDANVIVTHREQSAESRNKVSGSSGELKSGELK